MIVNISFAVDDNYIKYLAVAINSLGMVGNSQNTYRVYVLNCGIKDANKQLLFEIAVKYPHIELRFVDVSAYFDGIELYTGSGEQYYLTATTYYRLCLHDVLGECDKIIYVDCDVVFVSDPAELFDVDITGMMLAGVPDITANWQCRIKGSELRKYREKIGIDCLDNYINAGVLLLNLDYIRGEFPSSKLIEIAASQKWEKHDQDVINVITGTKKIILPYKWNLIEFTGTDYLDYITDEQREQYVLATSNVGIYHYAASKPWKIVGVQGEDRFWLAAGGTPVIYELIKECLEECLGNSSFIGEGIRKLSTEGILSNRLLIRLLFDNMFNRFR